MAPGRVAAFLPLALGRSLAPSNSPVSCRLECFRGRHAGPVEKGQQLGGPQPGDASVWVDPHVEVSHAAPADGSLFSSGGGVGFYFEEPVHPCGGQSGEELYGVCDFRVNTGQCVHGQRRDAGAAGPPDCLLFEQRVVPRTPSAAEPHVHELQVIGHGGIQPLTTHVDLWVFHRGKAVVDGDVALGGAVMHVHHACAHYFFFGFEGAVRLLPRARARPSPC